MTEKKNWNELSAQGQKARLTRFAKIRHQYGQLNGLFTVTHIADKGIINTKNGQRHSYGFRAVPAGLENCEDKALKDGQWIWFDELVAVPDESQEKLQKYIDLHQAWIDALNSDDTKSLLFSFDYKRNGRFFNLYRVSQVNRRHNKQAQAKQPEQPAQPAKDNEAVSVDQVADELFN